MRSGARFAAVILRLFFPNIDQPKIINIMARNKESFVFYKDWWNAISGLSEDVRGEVCESIIRYAFGETVDGLGNMTAMAMRFIAPQIDRDREKYEAKCERNRENGALGGRPRPDSSKPNGCDENRTDSDGNRMQANAAERWRTGSDNENVNENKNEKVNEKACESESEVACTPAHAPTPAFTPEEKDFFSKYQSWLTVNAPTVMLFQEPLRIDQFLWLHRTYGAQRLKQCSADIHNKEAYLRNRNAFNTFKLWIKTVKL